MLLPDLPASHLRSPVPMSATPHNDKAAAFRGLIITAILLFVVAYTVVLLTNRKFAGHEAGAAAAETH